MRDLAIVSGFICGQMFLFCFLFLFGFGGFFSDYVLVDTSSAEWQSVEVVVFRQGMTPSMMASKQRARKNIAAGCPDCPMSSGPWETSVDIKYRPRFSREVRERRIERTTSESRVL